jgi:lipopolysaccharide transport system permease protein
VEPIVTTIAPRRGWVGPRIQDLWRHRELLYFLALREVKVRYAQAALGAAWALLQPLLMMILFAVVLGRLAKVPSDNAPYPVFALAGLIPWTLFSSSLVGATNSLVSSAALVTRVYFPRLLLPLGSLLAALPDVAVASVLLVVVMLFYGMVPPVTILTVPLLATLVLLASAGTGILLAALNVAYRDIRYVVPFLVQLWLFATPVVYPLSLVPERYRLVFAINPTTGPIEGFRWAFLRTTGFPAGPIAVSALSSLVLLTVGVAWFSRFEYDFADVI